MTKQRATSAESLTLFAAARIGFGRKCLLAVCAVFCCCLLAGFSTAMAAATLPVPAKVHSSVKPAQAGTTAKTGKKTQAAAQKGKTAKTPGGFSSNPFALNHRDPPGKKSAPPQGRTLYVPGNQEKQTAPTEETISFSSSGPDLPDDRLQPRRTTFSGGPHTMARFDETPPPEVSMTYRVAPGAKTRVTVNPQDESSPLYRPVGQDGTVNSAGVYMDIEMQPNLQLRVGGEYCDVNDTPHSSAREDSARGAAVGLQWQF